MLAALVVTSTAVFFLDTIQRAVAEGPEIVVLASEARGLVPGAEVWVAGAPSGRVTRVRFDDPHGPAESRVIVHARLHRKALPFLRADTRATISSSALLAPVVLKLDAGHPASGPFDLADTLRVPAARTTDGVLALARSGRAEVESLAVLSRALSARLAEGRGTAARLGEDGELVERLHDVMRNAADLSAAIGSEESFLKRQAADSLGPTLLAMAGTLRALGDGERAEAVAGALSTLTERLDRISGNLERLDRELREGRGTAGRALYDDEIARQQEALRARWDSLRAELKKDPGRWLRFRLF